MDNKVEIDPGWIQEAMRDWDSPVGKAIILATEQVSVIAKAKAPVSPVGSLFAPTGFLKSHTGESATRHHDTDGTVLGLVGAPVYPFAFISNFKSRKGFTWNPPGRNGRRTKRPGNNNFLSDALDSLAFFEVGS